MLSINDYLDNILIDFESYARSGVKLCDLKAFIMMPAESLIIQVFTFNNYICFAMHMHILLSISACMKHCSTVQILAQA